MYWIFSSYTADMKRVSLNYCEGSGDGTRCDYCAIDIDPAELIVPGNSNVMPRAGLPRKEIVETVLLYRRRTNFQGKVMVPSEYLQVLVTFTKLKNRMLIEAHCPLRFDPELYRSRC